MKLTHFVAASLMAAVFAVHYAEAMARDAAPESAQQTDKDGAGASSGEAYRLAADAARSLVERCVAAHSRAAGANRSASVRRLIAFNCGSHEPRTQVAGNEAR